jgi:hypothetical protein
MPRGAKPGERRGGRAVGTQNRATREREILAQRIADEQNMKAAAGQMRKLGKETLEEFMIMFGGLAAAFQPAGQSREQLDAWASSKKEAMFEKYATLSVMAAQYLARYQSPTFRAVVIAPPPDPNKGSTRKKFTIGIFDGQGRPAPRHIDVVASGSVTKPPAKAGSNGSAPPSKLN